MLKSIMTQNNALFTDSLTNVFNRNFLEKFHKEHKYKKIGVVIFDFDNFRYLNDIYGYTFGDKVLKVLADKLKKLTNDNEFIVRFSGDKFLILYIDKQVAEIEKKALEIINRFNDVIDFEGVEILMTVSAGISIGNPMEDLYEIIRKADIALNGSKKSIESKLTIYDDSLEERIKRKATLLINLKNALENDEFYLVYQPIYDMNLSRIYEIEALARWRSKEFGEISPVDFIPLLEETKLIIDFGYVIIEKVFKQIKEWENIGINLNVNINVSPIQLNDNNLIKKLIMLKDKYNVDTNRVVFEITETQFVKMDQQKNEIINKLQEIGIKLAIDDYGTDYSQINNIIKIPAKEIKISKDIVSLINVDYRVKLMIKYFVELFSSLGYFIVAEGVETLQQFEYLKEIGCSKIQGFYISRPVNYEEIINLVKSSREI